LNYSYSYNELRSIILAKFLDLESNSKDYNDREVIFKTINEGDFSNRIDKLVFSKSKEIISDKKRTPQIKELAIDPDIAYEIYKKEQPIENILGKISKSELSSILKGNSSQSDRARELIKNKLNKILNPDINMDQEARHYIDEFKNQSHLMKVREELNQIQDNVNNAIKDGKVYDPGDIFKDGFNFIFRDEINNKGLKDIVEAQRKEAAAGNRIPTYIDEYDKKYLNKGIKNGYIEIIGAKTGMGKSVYAITRFYNQIINGYNVYYLSFEEDKNDILEKILTIHSTHDSKFKNYELTAKDWIDMGYNCKDKDKRAAIDEVVEDLKKYKFENHIIDMRSKNTVEDIKSQLINMSVINAKHKIDLIYLDHIHNIDSADSYNNFTNALKNIMGSIRVLASKSKIAISILSQLNDSGKGKPTKQNLKWSQSLANDAHLVTLLDRADYGLNDEQLEKRNLKDNDQMELIIDKNRHGETGSVKLYFDFEKTYIRGWKETDKSKNKVEEKAKNKVKDKTKRIFSKKSLEEELLPGFKYI